MSQEIYKARRKPETETFSIRGVDYNCTTWGNSDAPLLVLLHGWGDTGSSFQFVADALPDEWRLVAPDWRGFGDTRHRAEAYWFPDYLADLDVLLDLLSPQAPVHLVGHSMGANIVGLYAGVMPERVRSMVNIEGFGLSERDPAGAPDNYRRWLQQSRARPVFAEYSRFEELVPRILHRSPRMGRDKARFVARQWARQDPDGRVRLKADPSHKLPNAVLYRRAEAEACWERVEAPVLLIVGADTQFEVARHWLDAGKTALPFPNAEVQRIDGAGHMVHFEQPAALAATIEGFIRPRL